MFNGISGRSKTEWVVDLGRNMHQGARFRFTVADDAGDDQVGIVERGPKGMAERIAQLARALGAHIIGLEAGELITAKLILSGF